MICNSTMHTKAKKVTRIWTVAIECVVLRLQMCGLTNISNGSAGLLPSTTPDVIGNAKHTDGCQSMPSHHCNHLKYQGQHHPSSTHQLMLGLQEPLPNQPPRPALHHYLPRVVDTSTHISNQSASNNHISASITSTVQSHHMTTHRLVL